IFCRVSLSHPINIKGHSRLRNNSIESIKHIYLSLSLPFSFSLIFPTSTCYSSLVSMAFEDVLASLPSLGQPYARLPRRGPSRASVRRIVAVVHGDQSDRSLWPVRPLHAGGVARSSSSRRAT